MLAVLGRRAVPTLRTVRPVVVHSRPNVQVSRMHISASSMLVEAPQVMTQNIVAQLNGLYESFLEKMNWLAAPREEAAEAAEEENTASWLSSILLARGTYKPHFKKRKRTVGFLARLATPSGRKVLLRRQAKGRKRMAA
eukprot:TRINITY_DN770_c1_g1_i1.p1 TRINITY_DN770_c1_g1~~TRINITY_DN770_c1_g1_i1.p1  ORF type:complete len:139 (-),score=39.90 TRINITY_DN770_c1_g1_i1:26-442(-)